MTAYSSVLTNYLGEGLAANRPTTLNISPLALGLYYATDTKVLSLWNGTSWDNDQTVQQWTAGNVSAIAPNLVLNGGTLSTAAIGAGMLVGNPGTAAATPSGITLGSNLTLSPTGTLSAAGAALTIQNNGTLVDAAATTLNFTGSVSLTDTSPGVVGISITGGSSLVIEANGTVQAGVTALNFSTGTTVAVAGGVATITAPPPAPTAPEVFVVSQSNTTSTSTANTNQYIGFNKVEIDTDGVASSAVSLSAPVFNTAMQGITVPAAWNGKTAIVVGNIKLQGESNSFTIRMSVYRPSASLDITTAESTGAGGYTNPGRSLTTPPVVLATGDIIYLYAYHSTANATLASGASANRLGVVFLGGGSGGGGAGVTSLSALTDVDESTLPTTGQALVFNASGKWKPTTQPSPLSQQVYSGPWRGAQAILTSNKATTTNTWATLTWDTTAFQTDGIWSVTTPTRLTVPAGVSKVRLSGHVQSTGGVTQTLAQFTKNGAGSYEFATSSTVSGIYSNTSIKSKVLSVVPGDYFEFQANGVSAGLTLDSTQDNYFQMEIVELTTATYRPYDLGLFAPGKPGAGALLDRYVCNRALTLPVGATNSQAYAGTAPLASATFSIQKNGVTIGSISFAASSQVGTFTVSAVVAFVPGDRLELIGPSTQDTNLADVSVTLAMLF